MFFADFSDNSQPIFMIFFLSNIFEYPVNLYCKISINFFYVVQKLDHLTCAGVELKVDGMPIHRTGKSKKLPCLSKNFIPRNGLCPTMALNLPVHIFWQYRTGGMALFRALHV